MNGIDGVRVQNQKVNSVADVIHGIIPVTAVERYVLATAIFNRLHNVKQNSTAYLTYPSLTHSRFAHSLGVMHLAGRVFNAALRNAETDERDGFLHQIYAVIEKLAIAPTVNLPNGSSSKNIQTLIKGMVENVPMLLATAPHDLSTNQKLAFAIALQALRLAALVHDLGHPPFSHVTEYAVKRLLTNAASVAPNIRSGTHREAMVEISDVSLVRGKALHESLTQDLFSAIIDAKPHLQALEAAQLIGTDEHIYACEPLAVFSTVAFALAELILNGGVASADRPFGRMQLTPEQTDAIFCLHKMEDSELDVDRLDYVQRDTVLSGIRPQAPRLDRLLDFLKLVTYNGKPTVVPSVRSLRSLEEFFEWRSELYRTVIFHHHVVRTDSFLEELVYEIGLQESTSKRYKSSDDPPTLTASQNDVHWLWTIFSPTLQHSGPQYRERVYLQWDDSWLNALMRREYVTTVTRGFDSTLDDEGKRLLRVKTARLEEIVASKKRYVSLIKRFDDYHDVHEGFVSAIGDRTVLVTDTENPEFADVLQTIQSEWTKLLKPENSRFIPRNLTSLSAMIDAIRQRTAEGIVNRNHLFFSEVCACFRQKIDADDVFYVRKEVKPAIKDDTKFIISTDRGLLALSQLSGEASSKRKTNFYPEHFFYVLFKGLTSHDRGQLRRQLGACFAETLMTKSDSLLTKEKP